MFFVITSNCSIVISVWIESTIFSDITTSGLFLKDSLKVTAFTDPKVSGVTLYLSDFDRPALEKLGNVFDDPSSASIACVKTGPVVVKGVDKSKGGEEVFEESKNLIFKQIRVKRLLDENTNTLVYVSYSTRFDKSNDNNKSRFKSSMCAVNFASTERNSIPTDAQL